MSDKLPDNVIQLTILSINYNKRKNCQCLDSYPPKQPSYIVDYQNREVICRHCGVIVDSFEALYNIALNRQRMQEETERLFEQRKEIANYKPWLLKIRDLERKCREGTMVLSCPHCHDGILFDEMTHWVNKDIVMRRRAMKVNNT